MTYELAKQLKDAEFAVPHRAYQKGEWNAAQHNENEKIELCYFPTLSELIEECGKGLWTMKRGIYRGEDGWCVGQDDHNDPSNVNKWKLFIFDRSLEIAVAKLWLALNA